MSSRLTQVVFGLFAVSLAACPWTVAPAVLLFLLLCFLLVREGAQEELAGSQELEDRIEALEETVKELRLQVNVLNLRAGLQVRG